MTRILTIILMFAALLAFGQEAQNPAASLWERYKAGQFEEVVKQGQAMLNTGTESAQIALAVGRALTDLGQSEAALPYLIRAVKNDPDRTWVYAWAQVYLGHIHARLGDLKAATEAYKLARDCGATRNATRSAFNNMRLLGLDEFYDDWPVVETDHFVFHFSPRLGIMDRSSFILDREAAYATIQDWFGGGPAEKVRFFVWADPVEAEMSGMPPLGFARAEYYLIHAHVKQTRGHEITHVVSQHAVLPMEKTGLINEGIAIVHDQTGRDTMERARQAVAMGRKGLGGDPFVEVGVRALWEDWSLLTDTYSYPIAAAFTEVLLEKGGKETYLVFFADQTYAHAQEVYGPELETWIDAFEAALYGQG